MNDSNREIQSKKDNDLKEIEKIIKKKGYMAVIENPTLKELYEKIKECSIKDFESLEYNTNISDLFYRGRLFDKGKAEKSIKKENESKEYLSFVQPPLNWSLNSARFNNRNVSYFYISDNKYAPYFELEKYKEENKYKELFIQKFKLKNEFKLINSIKINNFIRGKLNFSQETFETRGSHLLSNNYDISNFFLDLLKCNENFDFHGILYDNKKNFDFFNSDRNFFIDETQIKSINIFYYNITFFSDYWNYDDLKFNHLFDIEEPKNTSLEEIDKKGRIEELTYKSLDKCTQANDYFKEVEKPKMISVEEIMIAIFEELKLTKRIGFTSDENIFLELKIKFNFEKLIKIRKLNLNKFLDIDLVHPDIEFVNIPKKSLKLKLRNQKNKYDCNEKYEIEFSRKDNQINYIEDEKRVKIKIFNFFKEYFEKFFGIYYKLEKKAEFIYLTKIK